MSWNDFATGYGMLAVEMAMITLALLVLALGLLSPVSGRKVSIHVVLLGLVAITAWHLWRFFDCANLFGGIYQIDVFSNFFKLLILVALVIIVLCSATFIDKIVAQKTEFYGFMIFAALGMMVLSSAGDLITLYVGLELMTVSFYILVGYCYEDQRSAEAGLKYLILGAIGSAFLLLGMSYIVALTGTTIIGEMAAVITLQPALIAGVVMMLAGFVFKVGLIPFHMWVPDIYEGAPTPVTMFLSVASKAVAFAAMVRVFLLAFPEVGAWLNWQPLLAGMAALTIIAANMMAIPQTNAKRMLAYSSIAQAGYIILGLIAANHYGMQGLLYYSMLYVFSNLGAFAVVSLVETEAGNSDFSSMAGLGRRSPFLAAVMSICLLSLAGIPPLAGFVGKLYLFTGVVQAGYLWLAFVGLVMSMISAYYYLNFAKVMYADEAINAEKVKVKGMSLIGLWVCLLGTIFLGVYPGPLADIAGKAIQIFAGL